MIEAITALLGKNQGAYFKLNSQPVQPTKRPLRQLDSGRFQGRVFIDGVLDIVIGREEAFTLNYISGKAIYRTYFIPSMNGKKAQVFWKMERVSDITGKTFEVTPDWQNTKANIEAKVKSVMGKCLDMLDLGKLPPQIVADIKNCYAR